MVTTRSTIAAMAVLATLAMSPLFPGATADVALTTVNVTVQYTGQGEVDATHRIWIWLFDSPDFSTGTAMPLAEQSLTANDTTASFAGLTADQVWVAVAYDAAGGFAGNAPPPSGAPVSTYLEDGVPASVALGERADVRIVFDDSFRMP